jgi:CubicO group peptidase (beta-lactamase class C family)
MTLGRRIFCCRIANEATEIPANGSELIFPYWSFTKTAIAICALRLVQDGKINLDRSVDEYPFTLRQLLNHTAGLPDYHTLRAYKDAGPNDGIPWHREDLLSAAIGQGTLFPPGSDWAYSNIGYLLVRQIIEQMAGKSFSLLFKEVVGDVLGLGTVELATTREQFSRVFWKDAKHYDPQLVSHGCLIGTARDAASLLHGLFAGKLLRPETMEQMLFSYPLGGGIAGRPWTECGYALGLMSGRLGRAGRAIGHSGAGPFCVNAVYHFPDWTVPVTVACFTDGSDESVAEFAAVDCAKGQFLEGLASPKRQ